MGLLHGFQDDAFPFPYYARLLGNFIELGIYSVPVFGNGAVVQSSVCESGYGYAVLSVGEEIGIEEEFVQ